MTESYESDPFMRLTANMGANDETIFEDSLNTLHKAGLENATRTELCLVLGMAVGTVLRLRRRIGVLEDLDDGK